MAKGRNINKKEEKVEIKNNELCNDSKVLTEEEICREYNINPHTWEGTVALWAKKKELGIE